MKAIVLALALGALAGPTWAAGPWVIQSRKDPISDLTRTSVSVRNQAGALALKCDSPGSSIYVQFVSPRFLGSSGNETPDVTFRFDTDPPQYLHWSYNKESAVLFPMADVERFAARLARAKKIVIRAITFDGYPVEAAFDVAPADPAVQHVYSACGFGPPLLSAP